MDAFQILAIITFIAAAVNGGVGYGFSSLTVPIALIFFGNKVLNPALVLVAIVLNGYVLAINRRSIAIVWRRVLPVLLGLVPGIVAGSYILASLNPEWLKFATYLLLLPIILIQAGGIRRPIRSEHTVGFPLGAGVGVLYSVTTISGPPMALLFNNQGLVHGEFRAAMAMLRVAESILAAIVYYFLGLFTADSAQLSLWILPGVVAGVPLGSLIMKRVHAKTFRRFCMSSDACIVGYGLSRVLIVLQIMNSPVAYIVWFSVAFIDACLLYLYFGGQQLIGSVSASPHEDYRRRR